LNVEIQKRGILLGLLFYAIEAIQSILLIPLMKDKLGETSALSWVALVSAGGLVSFAYSAYYQSLVRELAKFFDYNDTSIPENFNNVKSRISIWGSLVLLVSFGIFVTFYFVKWGVDQKTLILIFLYFSSLFFKLHTFNIFIFLNAKKHVGFDKSLLFLGSFISLLFSLFFLFTFKRVEWLGLATLISSILVYVLARRKLNKILHGLQELKGANIQLDFSEKFLILLLNLGGYLKLNTDVVISSYLLSDSDSLQYAFWVRIFYMLVSLIGLWSQVRFPFWSIELNFLQKHLREIKFVVFFLFAIELLILAAYFLSNNLNILYLKDVFGIDFRTLAFIFISIFFAGATYVLDQLLMSRKAYNYLWFAILISFLAPFMSFLFGYMCGGANFILGFVVAHFILLVIDVFRIKKLKKSYLV
jgi:hypothetical protein